MVRGDHSKKHDFYDLLDSLNAKFSQQWCRKKIKNKIAYVPYIFCCTLMLFYVLRFTPKTETFFFSFGSGDSCLHLFRAADDVLRARAALRMAELICASFCLGQPKQP